MVERAAAPRRGLGRGLEALVGGAAATRELVQVPIEEIHPNARQPRERIDPEPLEGLAESVRANGLLQPVVVRPRPAGGYELIAGERRWRAAREAGLHAVPALVRDAGDRDSLLLALVENIAREELSAVEEARAYAVLLDEFGLSLGEVAERLGRAKSTVSNRIRLLELPGDVLELVADGHLTEGHARALLAVPDHAERRRLALRAVREGMSVRGVERAARAAGARRRVRVPPVDPALAARVGGAIRTITGRPARIAQGRIEIAFADAYELEQVAEALEHAAANIDTA